MDYYKVIYHGHSAKQPLIGPSSELGDGLEPHARFRSTVRGVRHGSSGAGREGCTRGGAGWVVPGGCYTGYPADGRFEAYLMEYEI